MTTYRASEIGWNEYTEGGYQLLTDAPLEVGDTIVFSNTEVLIYSSSAEVTRENDTEYKIEHFVLEDCNFNPMRYTGAVRVYVNGARVRLNKQPKEQFYARS